MNNWILVREDEDEIGIVDIYPTVQQAWEGWKHHVLGEPEAVGGMFTSNDGQRLLEWENLRSYRSNTQRFSYRLFCLPEPRR